MDNLLYGAVISILAYRRLIYIPVKFQPFLPVGALAAIFAIAYLVPNTDRGVVWFVESSSARILTAILIAVYLAAQRPLHFPVIAWLGRISYSVYLVHAIPLDYAQWIWSGRGTTFVLLTLTILFSVALHYLIEKPGIALGRRLTADAHHGPPTIGKPTRELAQ
jgi:peptidoglycan/LPS O-acetylase OafA/YrhL